MNAVSPPPDNPFYLVGWFYQDQPWLAGVGNLDFNC
jgi:hypothetical protein